MMTPLSPLVQTGWKPGFLAYLKSLLLFFADDEVDPPLKPSL
jgi:hypothetical protein